MSRNLVGNRKSGMNPGTKSKSSFLKVTTTLGTKKTPTPASSVDSDVRSKTMVPKSLTKKLSQNFSKGDLTAAEALNILSEIQIEKEKELIKEQQKFIKPNTPKTPKRKETNVEIVEPEEPEVLEEQLEPDSSPTGEITQDQIERENRILQKAEKDLEELKVKIEEKEIIFNKLLLELKRMSYIFNKVKEIDVGMLAAGKEINDEVVVGYVTKEITYSKIHTPEQLNC